MLDFLPQPAGTVAMRLTGRMHYEDFERAYQKLEEALASAASVNVYAEIMQFKGFDLDILFKSISIDRTLLDRLDRFGRVAVVSDQGWIRALARVESAILDKVTYRIFTPGQRDAALAWVEGRDDLPYGHNIRIIETDKNDVLGFEVSGHLGHEEVDRMAREVNALRAEHRPRAVLVRYTLYDGFDPAILLDREYAKMKLGLLRLNEKYALVGGPEWMRELVKTIDPLLKADLRTFDLKDEARAWEWLAAEPVIERPLAEA
ncbi:STAS/SEC14 domain-containing protein [Altererythrobacter aquiaggeris]|uniref:STAS/SEC14 domain-containing protein n=1 Tax=Aestuarierythrobacter aquiaggeris TaxID=1898396 RepID=UPI00301B21EB